MRDKSLPNICIDCSPLLVRSAGVKTYLYHWLKALRAASPETIRTFLAPNNLSELLHEGGIQMHRRQILSLVSLNILPQLFTDMAAPRCDVFHVSNLLRRIPTGPRISATIHDLTPWILPECHTPATVAAEKAFAARILARAASVMADSENTRIDAIRILGIAPDKIRVIYLGVPDWYFGVSLQDVASAADACQLRRPYFLSIGTIEPRKNVDTLLAAWSSLPTSFRDEYELVIVGMPGWQSDATMQRIRDTEAGGGGVRYLGYVAEPNLPGLTAGATALVYPSLYEGFGLPVAQAMAAGCPVVTSRVSSLPEVAGDAALMIDPLSVSDLATAIFRMGDSSELRERLRTAGIVQAARFTWDKAAGASLRYFSAIADQDR
jgi:glycosyltransferase involved in cell wall biosynthesis